MAVLGVVTIGQAPRADLTGELVGYLPCGATLLERGALDELKRSAIAALTPEAVEDTLTSRLRDGTSVVLDRRRLVPLLEDALATLERRGAEANLLVCTGSFPLLRHRRPLLDGEHLLVHGVSALLHGMGRLGVVVPLPAQQHVLAHRWNVALNASVLVDHADPYAADVMNAVPAAVGRLASAGARIVILDCMGFTEAMREAARQAGIPVLLARSVVGRLAGEFMGAQCRTEKEEGNAVASGTRPLRLT